MKASQQRQVFGVGSDPSIEVRLPYQLKASEYSPVRKSASRFHNLGKHEIEFLTVDARCEMVIDMTGKPTIGTWYQIWEATLALGSVCMRGNEKGGRATGLG